MAGGVGISETHSLRGPIDRPALLTIQNIIDRDEPLATPILDDYLNPTVLEVTLDDGLCRADSSRIDVQWTIQADYKFHYTDSEGVNVRWGKHPHDGEYIHVLDSSITIRHPTQLSIPTRSENPASSSPPKSSSLVPSSNSGASPITQTPTPP